MENYRTPINRDSRNILCFSCVENGGSCIWRKKLKWRQRNLTTHAHTHKIDKNFSIALPSKFNTKYECVQSSPFTLTQKNSKYCWMAGIVTTSATSLPCLCIWGGCVTTDDRIFTLWTKRREGYLMFSWAIDLILMWCVANWYIWSAFYENACEPSNCLKMTPKAATIIFSASAIALHNTQYWIRLRPCIWLVHNCLRF